MEIQWFTKSLYGVVTIYETNITLNTVAAEHFVNAYSTLIGFDKRETTLLIKALNKEEAVCGKYSENDLHPISIKPSYGRINGKMIIKNICECFPLDFQKQNFYKFKCEWDAANKYLKIYLKEAVL